MVADDMSSDAKNAAKIAKDAKNDVKTAKKLASQMASGNYVGAIKTTVSNPKFLLTLALILVIIFLIPIIVGIAVVGFLLELPGTIVESTQSAVEYTVDNIVLGWEDYKAKLNASIDDFLTVLTTGESGGALKAYKDDVAFAEDPVFIDYMGTSNTIVAVLNSYLRDSYTAFNEKAQEAAQKEVDKLKKKAMEDGVEEGNIMTSIDPEIEDAKNYLNWTFYIMAGDSYQARTEEGLHFRVANMVKAAKELEKSRLWKVDLDSSSKVSDATRVWWTEEEVEEQMQDETGNPLFDENGDPVMHTVTKKVENREDYKIAVISVKYGYSPAADAKDYILEYYHVTDEKKNDTDISDKEICEEEVEQLRKIYNAYEDAMNGDSTSDTGGPPGALVLSGSIKAMIDKFYASHSQDELFAAPSGLIAGPWSGWKNLVTSRLGAKRGDSRHNGTDIAPGMVQRPLVAPYQGIVVGVQSGFANGGGFTKGTNEERGNLVMVYYGERGSSADGKNGVFVLYQHLSPPINWNVGDTISAGETIACTGWSGYCVSSSGGTGEHLHLELYFGYTQVDPEDEMSN